MAKNKRVIRIPKDMIPLWESIKNDMSREIKDATQIDEDGLVMDRVAFQKVITDFKKRDYYLVTENIRELSDIIRKLTQKIDSLSSQVTRVSIKLARGV